MRPLPCDGKVAGSIINFVQIHSDKVHADVINSGMNILNTLCSDWKPHKKQTHEWVESLAHLLEHENHDLVVKKALKALLSIFGRFISYGHCVNSIVADGLIANLSRHLYKASANSGYIDKANIPVHCGPPLLELARLHAMDEAENQGKYESYQLKNQ